MMSEIAPEGLGFSFPIWTVVDALIYAERGFPFAIVTAGSTGHGSTLPLFERPMMATIWGAALEKGGQKLEPFPVSDATLLLQLMDYYQEFLVNHVAINPNPSRQVDAERYVSFGDVRAALGAV
jgi:hypothetical protein